MAILHRVLIAVSLTAAASVLPERSADAQAEISPYTRRQLGDISASATGAGNSIEAINRRSVRSGLQVGVAGVGAGGVQAVPDLTSSPTTIPRRRAATFDSFSTGAGGSKPFTGVNRGPTVSPYLNLFVGSDGLNDEDVAFNYQTLVKPQIQQQEINQQLQQQQQQLNRQVQQLTTRPAFNPQGSQYMSPTGHPTAFMNYSHFYPAAAANQQQGRQR